MRKELVDDTVGCGVVISTANFCVSFGEQEEESNVRTVIDDYKLAEQYFTAKH